MRKKPRGPACQISPLYSYTRPGSHGYGSGTTHAPQARLAKTSTNNTAAHTCKFCYCPPTDQDSRQQFSLPSQPHTAQSPTPKQMHWPR